MFDFFFKPFKDGNALRQLIYINVGIFLLVAFLKVVLQLFNINFSLWADNNLCLTSQPAELKFTFWTLITYMFLHFGLWHLFFNMLCLYWFGLIFLKSFSKKQLTGLYLLGGIIGGLFYILCYSILPFFAGKTAILCGASAAITAIIIAAAFALPNMPLRLLFIGEVKLKYFALVIVLISVFGVAGNNAGGEISHLGGAVAGWIWWIFLKKNRDLTKPFDKIITFFVNIFNVDKKPLKVRKNPKYHYVKSDATYNQERARNNAEMDKILDKIRISGYASLTESEKSRLFEVSEKL
jgi:membrane associated rhomboid family serine protease